MTIFRIIRKISKFVTRLAARSSIGHNGFITILHSLDKAGAARAFDSPHSPREWTLMTRSREVMEMQNWRTELKVVVADARHELIPVCSLARAFQPGSRAHLRICLGKLDSRLTCSLVASPFSVDSYLFVQPALSHPSFFTSSHFLLLFLHREFLLP